MTIMTNDLVDRTWKVYGSGFMVYGLSTPRPIRERSGEGPCGHLVIGH